MNAAQIRKDLAHLGEFGVRGVGYRVSRPRGRASASILGLDRVRVVVIVGAGNLGQALADSRNFNGGVVPRRRALRRRRAEGGRKVPRRGSRSATPPRSGEAVAELGADIGVVAVPVETADRAARALAAAGVRGILNFAPARVGPYAGTTVKNVDLTLSLETLAIQISAGG